MVYEADRTVTLLEAIAEAGGVSNDAGDTVIVAESLRSREVTDPKPIAEQNAPGAGWRLPRMRAPAAPSAVQKDQSHVSFGL